MASSLDKKILKVLKENKVSVTEASDASGAQDQGGTHVKPEYIDLGAAVVSPTTTEHPDYTKGTPTQPLRKMDHAEKSDISGAKEEKGKVTNSEIEEKGDGPELKKGEKIVAEDNSLKEQAKRYLKRFNEDAHENPFAKKDDVKKDDGDKKDDHDKDDTKPCDVKEDITADAENDRQKAKRAEGEPMHHLETGKLDAPAAAKSVTEDEDKKDLKEDITALFAGEKITEAFKKKAATIFEAAVNTRVAAIVERKQAEIAAEAEKQLTEAVEQIEEAMANKVDTYLNYVAEEWIRENQLPIENTIRATIAEDFISGLKTLFENHYIEIPNDKIDVLGTLAAKVETLETKLNEQIETNISISQENSTYKREKAFASITEGLAASQVDKLKTLSENVEYKDAESYVKNLEVLRESYFPTKGNKVPQNLTEEVDAAPIVHEQTGEKAAILKQISKMNEKPF